MNESKLQELTSQVEKVALEAGSFLLKSWNNVGKIQFKNRRDIVTESDLISEKIIVKTLETLLPNAGFASEEEVQRDIDADYVWIIDPIDGTKYYSYQMPIFAVSIALFFKGEPLLGVVYNPASRQLFSAYKNGGATLNDSPLEVEQRTLAESIISVDMNLFQNLTEPEATWCKARLSDLMDKTYRVRLLGNGSLSLCFVATGALDAYIDITGRAKIQDKAAGILIAQEAGARYLELDTLYGPPKSLIAGPQVFTDLSSIITCDVSSYAK